MKKKSSSGAQLKKLLAKGPLIVPGAADCLTALLIKKAGFKAMYLTGAGLSVSYLGKPDIGLLTLDEVVGSARRLTEAVDLPLIVDADTGFGGASNVARVVRELQDAGAAAVQIEDQTFPKRCGHLSGKSVVPVEQMVQKIKAAVRARRDKSFLIVARTDARAVAGVKEALRRAQAYAKAGADIIFPEALESREEFRLFGQKKTLGHLMANMTEFGRSPFLPAAELARLGFRLILYPMTAFRVAARALESALETLKRDGHNQSLLGRMQTRKELYSLIGYANYDEWEKNILKK